MKLLSGRRALTLLSTCALGAIASGCSAQSASTPAAGRAAIFPLVDHHQHLMSPTNLAQREQPATLPTAALPPELDRLLEERGAISGSTAPNQLFTEDAQLLRILQGDWVKGPRKIEQYLGTVAKGLTYRPTSYRVSGSAGYIAGNVRLGEPAKDILNFVIGIERGADGQWRIAAESATVIPPPDYSSPITADTLIANLDEAGISRGVVHSIAYSWASQFRDAPVADEYDKVRAENDWTAKEVARYPDRLVAFCGVNPLRNYAIAELERCAKIPQVKGMKLHFHNSGVDVRNPEHVEKLRRFFAAANANGLAILAHLLVGGDYGAEHSRIFLNRILPAAPDVPVQIAHLAGSGPGYDGDAALGVFADAFAAADPRLKKVYVDVAGVVPTDGTAELMAKRMRQIGLERILFGADMHPNPPPSAAWSAFRRELPFTDAELSQIADNVAPYLR